MHIKVLFYLTTSPEPKETVIYDEEKRQRLTFFKLELATFFALEE